MVNIQTIQKSDCIAPFINKNIEYALPNDNSFYVFASKSDLTNQIEAVLNQILVEQADIDAAVIVQYLS